MAKLGQTDHVHIRQKQTCERSCGGRVYAGSGRRINPYPKRARCRFHQLESSVLRCRIGGIDQNTDRCEARHKIVQQFQSFRR
jgi:hypothetical protein